MIPIEQFMAEYFRERTRLCHAEIELLAPLRQAYFTTDCTFDSRRGNVEHSQAERILSVSHGDTETLVITTGFFENFLVRYNLRPSGDNWAIHHVDFRCTGCQGTGKARHGSTPEAQREQQCVICGGRGWILPNDD